jgi:hypothetical protein
MKNLGLLVFFVFCLNVSYAQTKNWAVGARFGEPTGINIKKHFNGNALDITLGFTGYGYNNGRKYWKGEYRRSTVLTVNYLWQKPITGVKGLDIYYGLGGQIGNRRYYDRDFDDERSALNLGLTGALGVEWFIPQTPISLYVDFGPYIELVPSSLWIWFDSGLGVRVNF